MDRCKFWALLNQAIPRPDYARLMRSARCATILNAHHATAHCFLHPPPVPAAVKRPPSFSFSSLITELNY